MIEDSRSKSALFIIFFQTHQKEWNRPTNRRSLTWPISWHPTCWPSLKRLRTLTKPVKEFRSNSVVWSNLKTALSVPGTNASWRRTKKSLTGRQKSAISPRWPRKSNDSTDSKKNKKQRTWPTKWESSNLKRSAQTLPSRRTIWRKRPTTSTLYKSNTMLWWKITRKSPPSLSWPRMLRIKLNTSLNPTSKRQNSTSRRTTHFVKTWETSKPLFGFKTLSMRNLKSPSQVK